MEPVKDFTMVLELLKKGEIVCIANPRLTYFGLTDQKIQAKSDRSHYTLDLNLFEEMFEGEDFYLSKRKEVENIDETKDEEYYAWRHK